MKQFKRTLQGQLISSTKIVSRNEFQARWFYDRTSNLRKSPGARKHNSSAPRRVLVHGYYAFGACHLQLDVKALV